MSSSLTDSLRIARTPRHVRLRALFDEAWRRRRQRRRRVALTAAVVTAAVALGNVLTQREGSQSVPPQPMATAPLVLRQQPMVGVACPKGNDISCDRVGVAVWLDSRPVRVTATIDGRTAELADMHMRCRAAERCGYYSGYVERAGLIDGSLRVTPDHGRLWYGSTPVVGVVELRARYRDGRVASATHRFALRPGWG